MTHQDMERETKQLIDELLVEFLKLQKMVQQEIDKIDKIDHELARWKGFWGFWRFIWDDIRGKTK